MKSHRIATRIQAATGSAVRGTGAMLRRPMNANKKLKNPGEGSA